MKAGWEDVSLPAFWCNGDPANQIIEPDQEQKAVDDSYFKGGKASSSFMFSDL